MGGRLEGGPSGQEDKIEVHTGGEDCHDCPQKVDTHVR
jgi:hypothetical protein